MTTMLALQSGNVPDLLSGSASNRLPVVSGVRRRSALDLEVIIPAFNEVGRLPLTLRRTVEFLSAQPWRSRVVVVDNGSVDDTIGAVWRFADGLDGAVPVEVVGCARPGKGAAVRRGLLSSTSRFVGFFDADLATPVETLTAAMGHLQQDATAVIASRHVTGASFVRPQSLGRRAGGAAFRVLAHDLVSGVHDTQCGFKFFQRDAVMRALAQCQTTGFAFDVELLQRIQRDGGSIVEVPVAWTDDTRSTFHPVRDGLASFGAVLQMYRSRP
jgi:dolichyl-phosphate beta-glucosyltransferase